MTVLTHYTKCAGGGHCYLHATVDGVSRMLVCDPELINNYVSHSDPSMRCHICEQLWEQLPAGYTPIDHMIDEIMQSAGVPHVS